MQIGNIDWKHKKRLETIVLDWKQKRSLETTFQIENKNLRLEKQKLDWKQNKYTGNNLFRLETFTDMQGHNKMPSKLSKRVFINDK